MIDQGNWLGQLIRLTLFTAEGADVSRWDPTWEQITGGQLETDERRVRESVRRLAGPSHEESTLTELLIQPARVDVLVTPSQKPNVPPSSDFGPAWGVARDVVDRVPEWLSGFEPSISRVAFGAVVLLPVSDRDDGYRMISRLVPSLQLDDDAELSDLLFQVNRPRMSGVIKGLRLNRLMKWSVQQTQAIQMVLQGEGAPVVSLVETNQSHLRLELDLNTAPGKDTILKTPETSAIFSELYYSARLIADNGERA